MPQRIILALTSHTKGTFKYFLTPIIVYQIAFISMQ